MIPNAMDWGSLLPLVTVLSSAVPGIIIFMLAEHKRRERTILNLFGALVKLALIGIMFLGLVDGKTYELRFPLLPGFDFVLQADALAMLFVSLSAVLWLVTTIYAIAYLEESPRRSRFFGFFSLCVSATTGIALAGNLITFIIFYEALTLATYPLVIHRGDRKSLRAGQIYLMFTLTAGAVLLFTTIWLHTLVGPFDFTPGGALYSLSAEAHRPQLILIFFLLALSFGVKAALIPLHPWLPRAMVAPAPVSALLHAVAVVKAGAFGIVRLVYEVFGAQFSAILGVTTPLALLASATILYGSLRALMQDDLKRRLAYSTVSQVSYIVLGVAILGPLGTIGGLAHLVHQGLMKVTMFFCAGIYAETLGVHRVSEMNGIGRRMPLTTAAFTVTALGMIGLPPLAGFISKWYIAQGAVVTQQYWILGVLVLSTLMNAAYFLPILYRAWFAEQEAPWPHEGRPSAGETPWGLLAPPLVTALLTIAVGVFAATPFSVVAWAELIASREYLPW
jgi:multicomponent Na+:H+ antiporter subunit D